MATGFCDVITGRRQSLSSVAKFFAGQNYYVFDGAIYSLEWKEAKLYGTTALSRELGINVKTVAKWRKRETLEDRKTGPTMPSSTVLSGG